MSDETPQPPAPKSGGGISPRALIVGVAVNLLLTGGAVAFVVLRSSNAAAGHPPAAEAPAKEGEGHGEAAPAAEEQGGPPKGEGGEHAQPGKGTGAGPLVRIENIVVHLRNPEVDRYARMAVDIELSRSEDIAVLQSDLPKVKDAVITLLSDCSYEDLRGSAGITKLKADLLQRIGAIVGGTRAKAVYVTEFVIQ